MLILFSGIDQKTYLQMTKRQRDGVSFEWKCDACTRSDRDQVQLMCLTFRNLVFFLKKRTFSDRVPQGRLAIVANYLKGNRPFTLISKFVF